MSDNKETQKCSLNNITEEYPEGKLNETTKKTNENLDKEDLEDIDITLTSVLGKVSMASEILEKDFEKNEKICIFEINGKTILDEYTWKIYRTAQQLIYFFSDLYKTLLKEKLMKLVIVILIRKY